MTPIQRKIQRDKKLIKAYITEHTELKEFTSFGSYLSSYANNPRIRFEMIRDKKHHVPIVSISDSKKRKPVTLICLADMSNLKIETEDCTGCTFDRYSIRFTLEKPIGKLDYDMNIVIDK